MNPKRHIQLFQDVLESPCLESAGAGLGVAMHRVAHPQDSLSRLAHGFDHFRQRALHILRTEAMNEGQPSGYILRIQRSHEALQPRGIHRRADLHPHGVRDAAKVFDMRAVELCRSHTDPRHVRRQVVPAVLARNEARLSLLVQQVQSFVTTVEINEGRLVHAPAADALEEIESVADGVHDALVRVL